MSTPFEDLPDTPFGTLFDELDDIDELLNEGPAIGENESDRFLRELQGGIEKALSTAQGLTVDDVDAEFTETEDTNDGDENIEAQIAQLKNKSKRRSARA